MKTRSTYAQGSIARNGMLYRTLRALPAALAAMALVGNASAQVTYNGLSNKSLGNAQIITQGGDLVVVGLGDSGNDGLTVDLGTSGGLRLDLPAANGPDGSTMVSTSYHNSNNITTSVTTSVAGNVVSVTADFSAVGATSRRVEILSNGQVVASVVHGDGPDVTYPPATKKWFCHCTGGDGVDHTAAYIYGVIKALASDAMSFTLPDGQVVTGDAFRLTPVDETIPIEFTSRGDVTAKGMPGFTINREYVEILGQFHSGAGTVTLDPADPVLHVNDIPADASGGVDILLNDAAGFDAHTDPIALQNDGATLDLRAVGDFSGIPNSDLGGATIKNDGENLALTTFYDGVNAPNVKIEFVNGSQVVGTTVVPAGNVGEIVGTAARITGCGKVPPRPPIGTSCIWIELENPSAVRASNGVEFTVNTIRLLADGASGPINSLSSYSIKATNVPSFTINNEFLYQHSTSLGVAPEPVASFTFDGASPNITRGMSTIGYRMEKSGAMRLEVLDTRGELVETLEDGVRAAGAYTLPYDAAKLPSGAYYLRFTTGSWSATSKLIVVR